MLPLIAATLSLSAPLILAAMAGLFSERSGVVNIALEGKMLTAACLGAAAGASTGSPWMALVGAIFGGVLLSLLHAWLTQTFRIDHIISGMGINALALGGTRVLSEKLPQLQSTTRIPSLSEPFFFGMAAISCVGAWLYLTRTSGGLRLLAAGSDPDKARTMGLNPESIRWRSLIASGILCGLAGALIVGSAGSFSKDMTSGRGFIALAALVLGAWKPWPALLGCVAFGFLSGLQLFLQDSGQGGLPPEVFQALPYLACLAALAVLRQRGLAPAGLGKP